MCLQRKPKCQPVNNRNEDLVIKNVWPEFSLDVELSNREFSIYGWKWLYLSHVWFWWQLVIVEADWYLTYKLCFVLYEMNYKSSFLLDFKKKLSISGICQSYKLNLYMKENGKGVPKWKSYLWNTSLDEFKNSIEIV